MAGRPYWSGQLRISLVAFGIQLFPATSSTSEVSFHQIDRKTHQRVHHLNVINGDQPVANDDIVKGFEYSKGNYIIVEPDEIKNLRLATQKTISVAQFIEAKSLPPYLFEKPYFVVPDQKGSAEAFAVVREAMIESDKVAIGEAAFAGREHLITIAPHPDKKVRGMMAYTLRYAEELRKAKDYFGSIPEQSIDKKQLELANQLIKSQSAPFNLDEFKDDYEAALRELIDAKRNDKALPEVEEKPRPKVVNLMDALRKSVDESKAKPTSRRTSTKGPRLVKTGKRSRRAA
ncbi:Ku protein [Occallatibacter savannae]|uniref:non-homologous end joining protein Ku n=1 Tax=Occallatibacter savannae TaxID=1002691 RepID=UPI000D69D346|nr:Ku protein [Occallatibacter savannae]